MRYFTTSSIAFAALFSLATLSTSASAHIQLMFPEQRHTDQKTGPCGALNDARGDKITALEPGSKITVQWDETVEHPGHFRIMLDEDGFDFPEPTGYDDFCDPTKVNQGIHCLSDNIPDKAAMPNYSVEVTLPDIECDNCTLQVIQVMSDKPPWGPGGGNDLYYQCADITMKKGGGAGGGGAGGAGGGAASSSAATGAGGGASSSSGGDGGAGDGGSGGGGEESGCGFKVGAKEGSGLGAVLVALGLSALASRRRRRGAR
jgi:MYXO-CTERM domain-containing protein